MLKNQNLIESEAIKIKQFVHVLNENGPDGNKTSILFQNIVNTPLNF